MRRILTVPTVILTVVFLIAGCTSGDDTAEEPTTEAPTATVAPPETATADSSSDDSNELYVGDWVSNSGFYEQYREDGTYSIGRNLTGLESNPIEVGTYEFDGETLRIRAFDDSEFCAGIEAVYEAEFSESGTVVIHTLVTDDCAVRADGSGVPSRKLP